MREPEFRVEIRGVEPGTYEIVVYGEDDTIGHLLSTYLELSEEIQLSYYTRPHPLEQKIIIYVKLKDPNADLKNVLERVLGKVLDDLADARKLYLEALRRTGVNVEELQP